MAKTYDITRSRLIMGGDRHTESAMGAASFFGVFVLYLLSAPGRDSEEGERQLDEGVR